VDSRQRAKLRALLSVPLPETIAVRFTEEEADYVSIRPVKRQIFRLHELVDMVLSVTGRDLPRVQQILRAGTVVFHFYRYWWQGFDAPTPELSALLAEFPADDPSRVFDPASCTMVLLESATQGRQPVEVKRTDAERKSLFAARSFWDYLLAFAVPAQLHYAGYSFARRADLYRLDISGEQASILQINAGKVAPRSIRGVLETIGAPARLVFVCPRA
jgi:hypothetical protein